MLQLKPKGDGGGILTGMRTHVWAIKLTALSLAIIALPVARGPAPAAAAPPAPLSCHSGILRGLRCASWRVDPFMAIVWPFFYDFAGIFISFFFLLSCYFFIQLLLIPIEKVGESGMMASAVACNDPSEL